MAVTNACRTNTTRKRECELATDREREKREGVMYVCHLLYTVMDTEYTVLPQYAHLHTCTVPRTPATSERRHQL